VLTVYDPTTLAPGAEIVLPPKRAIVSFAGAVSGLTDDERFALVWNLTPATSVTVVDLDARAVVGVIETPGCSLVYPAGARRFAQLCMNGSLQVVALDDAGHEAARQRLPAFFDPESDPVMEKGVRVGARWLFPSFEGVLHEVDLSAAEPAFDHWPLVSDADRAAGWRVGGVQPVAAHAGLGRLYVLAHEGGPGSHKEPGTELWVYDLAARERVQRIVLENQGFTFLSFPLVPPSDLASPLAALMRWGLDQVSAGIAEVAVTQDASPILVTGGGFSGGLALYDATSGEFLRRVYTGNATNLGIRTPFGGAR
jgi:methylamine dehydrogenase heavy chain